MGLDVWFREDVVRVLRAAYVAGREAHLYLGQGSLRSEEDRPPAGDRSPVGGDRQAVPSREMAAYWRGYEAALTTIGAAFGLVFPAGSVAGGGTTPQLESRVLELKANGQGRTWDLGATGGGE